MRAKLKTADAAASLDPSYRRNVEALTAVQPVDLLPGDISARLGSSWIPSSDVKRFVSELLDVPERTVNVCHSGAIATWALTLDSTAKSNVSNTTAWERHGLSLPTSSTMPSTGARPLFTTRSTGTPVS